MMQLAIRLVPVGDTTLVIILTGELDATTTPTLAALLDPLPQSAVRQVIIAAQDLRLCDPSGLDQLTSTYRALQAAGGHLAIAAAPPALRRLIARTAERGEPTVPLHASVAAALSLLGTTPAPRPGHRPEVRTRHAAGSADGASAVSSTGSTRHRHHPPAEE
ncbi:STAS domain-containing protein [Nonomuraea sp. MTCD27]|uniref:STAS domain-containing protein n=1 Tax=Nonomuraea sp. MTCD27 TaxID=1676747 RepID=UPI0035C0BC51